MASATPSHSIAGRLRPRTGLGNGATSFTVSSASKKPKSKPKFSAVAPPTAEEIENMRKAEIDSVPIGLEIKFLRDTFVVAAETRPFMPLLNLPFVIEDIIESAGIKKTTASIKKLAEHMSMPNFNESLEKLGEKEHNVRLTDEVSMDEGLSSALKETYDTKTKPGDIPLYFVVYNPGHLTLFVLFAGKLYSLGLGFSESTKAEEKLAAAAGAGASVVKSAYNREVVAGAVHEVISKAALYNLDDVVIGGLDNTTSKGEPFTYPIASIGFFTKTHANRILAIARKNSGISTIVFSNEFPVMQVLKLNINYSKFSSPSIVSLVGLGAMNCTSFLEYVFSDKMTCVGSKGGYVFSHPHECVSYAPSLVKIKSKEDRKIDMNLRFKEVMYQFSLGSYEKETFDFLNFSYNPSTLHKLSLGILGKAGRRTRKNNRRF